MPLSTKVGFGPGLIVSHGDPASPHKRGTAPNLWPMSIVAKRSPISATAEHLLRYESGQTYTDIQIRSSQYFAALLEK